MELTLADWGMVLLAFPSAAVFIGIIYGIYRLLDRGSDASKK